MKLTKSLKLAFNILVHSKLRSWLTIIGIVIGVAAVVAIVSIGEGMQASVQSRLGGLGADLITVSPSSGRASGGFREGGFGGGPPRMEGGGSGGSSGSSGLASTAKNLTQRDVQTIQSVDGVAEVQGIVSGRGDAYYLSETTSLSVSGVDPLSWNKMTTMEIESGRFLGPSDYNMIVVGSRVAARTFKQPLALNRNIEIEGVPFKIVGIMKEAGGGDDGKVIMPMKAARIVIPDIGPDKMDSIIVKAQNTDIVDSTVSAIETRLTLSRHLTNRTKDFSVTSAKAQQQRISDITSTLTLFLGAIAAVSLIVGAIGIANTMFTSVLEKTKEIGIMKAIGARNRDILMIFLFNSAMVGMVGGLLGIALGATVSSIIPSLGIGIQMPGTRGGFTTALSPTLLFGTLSLAVGVGIAAGTIPAYRASRLKPVDALRYE